MGERSCQFNSHRAVPKMLFYYNVTHLKSTLASPCDCFCSAQTQRISTNGVTSSLSVLTNIHIFVSMGHAILCRSRTGPSAGESTIRLIRVYTWNSVHKPSGFLAYYFCFSIVLSVLRPPQHWSLSAYHTDVRVDTSVLDVNICISTGWWANRGK